MWSDPRQLERWWGPPTHPATFTAFDLRPGGVAAYYMRGPDGERYHGWWRFEQVSPTAALTFVDGFADDEGRPVDTMPTSTAVVELSALDHGTRMRLVSTFPSAEAMQQTLDMGMEEGLRSALSQIDQLLAT